MVRAFELLKLMLVYVQYLEIIEGINMLVINYCALCQIRIEENNN